MVLNHQRFDINDKCIFERMVFNPPLTASVNMEGEACFMYAIRGKSRLYSNSNHTRLHPETGALMKCGTYINHWEKSNKEEPYEAFAVHFYPEIILQVFDNELPSFLKQKANHQLVHISTIKIDEMILKFVESILFYFENPSLMNDELALLKLKEFILLLVNTDTKESERIRSVLQDMFNPLEYDFKKTINENLYQDLAVEDLATLCNLSNSSFKRKFKEVFQNSPARYIKAKRLEKAKELLQNSKERITDISFDCGFSDLGNFSKSFIKEFGVSPSSFRKQMI